VLERYPAGCFYSELTGNQEAVGAVTTVEWVDIAQPGLLYTYTWTLRVPRLLRLQSSLEWLDGSSGTDLPCCCHCNTYCFHF